MTIWDVAKWVGGEAWGKSRDLTAEANTQVASLYILVYSKSSPLNST